jgi:hypothetical protein
MDAISKPLISEHLQRKKSTPNLLSYFWGKTIIVKNFLLAQMGFETGMRGIPEKYKKRGE